MTLKRQLRWRPLVTFLHLSGLYAEYQLVTLVRVRNIHRTWQVLVRRINWLSQKLSVYSTLLYTVWSSVLILKQPNQT